MIPLSLLPDENTLLHVNEVKLQGSTATRFRMSLGLKLSESSCILM
jgi:hypothetical protein